MTVLLPLLAFAVLTLLNAFFVTAEFSLVTVDRAAIETQAQAGDKTARTVRRSLRELSFQLSGAQLGITLAALLTGFLAEPALAKLIRPIFAGWAGSSTDAITKVCALGLATLISMLFGELVPKNAALARPMPLIRATAGPLRTFTTITKWLIKGLNGSANVLVRRLGVEPQEELASARSPEELGLLAAISAQAGAIPADTAVLLRRTIRFGDKRAAEAMTPRVDVVGLDTTETVADLLAAARESGHSLFPVYEDTLDHIVGVASVVDALAVAPGDRGTTPVATIAREPVQVPESLDLGAVLQALDSAQAALAIVVDEYGGTDGVVTVEDLVEELVGEIADEHDPTEEGADDIIAPEVDPAAVNQVVVVDGMLREDELEEQTGFRPPPGPYETLAGFLMAELGHIPAEGETLAVPGWDFTVVEVVKRRVERVRVSRTSAGDEGS